MKASAGSGCSGPAVQDGMQEGVSPFRQPRGDRSKARSGIPAKRIPAHLSHRIQVAWERYDLCRRQLEAFLRQNAGGASSPSRAIVLPTPQPPIPLPLPARLQTDSAPLASPVPLSTASIFAFDGSKAPVPVSTSNAAVPGPGAPPITAPPIDLTTLDPSTFGLGDMPGGMDAMDLSSLGMDELSAIINGGSFPFSGDIGTGLGIGGLAAPAEAQAAVTPRTQAANEAATESFFASLTAAQPAPAQVSANDAAQTVAAGGEAQAGAKAATAVQSQSSAAPPAPQNDSDIGGFSFEIPPGMEGDVDLTDLSELAGLFDAGGALAGASRPVSAASTVAPSLQPPAEITAPSTATQTAAQDQPAPDSAKQKPTDTNTEATDVAEPAQTAPADEENAPLEEAGGDGQMAEYDFSNIDLDDFNFGDSALMNVEGDEFQSLLDEFN